MDGLPSPYSDLGKIPFHEKKITTGNPAEDKRNASDEKSTCIISLPTSHKCLHWTAANSSE